MTFAYPVSRVTDRMPGRVPKTLAQKVSVSPAVLPPEAGHSINPASEDYAAVFTKAAEVEFEKDRVEEKQRRKSRPVTTYLTELYGKEIVSAMTPTEKLNKYIELVRPKPKAAFDDILMEKELEPPTKRSTKPKTIAQRNKQLRTKVLERFESVDRKQRKLDKSIGEVGRVKKDLTKKDDMDSQFREQRAKKKAEEEERERKGSKVNAKRIGKHTFQPGALEVVYDADSRKTVREAAKVSAISTCAESYYRRNMLEATPENSRANARRVMKRVRKAKVKNRYVDPLMRDQSLLL